MPGGKLLRLPAPLLYGVTELSWLLRMQSSTPACGLDFIRYPWVVSGDKLEREHGLRAERGSEEAWSAFVSRGAMKDNRRGVFGQEEGMNPV